MRKTHSDKIREAVSDLGLARPNEIMGWITKHYPNDEVNPESYRADIIGCSVNHSSQHHYPSMPKFLWFNSKTKQYRLATPEEMPPATKTQKKTIPTLEDEITYINGIPVVKLSVTGQVLVPLQVRKKMDFNPGDKLAFVINEKGILEVRKARITLEFK